MNRRRSREDDDYSKYDKKFDSLILLEDVKKALDGQEMLEIKKHFIAKHVGPKTIMTSSITTANKIELLKLYFELYTTKEVDVYIERYFKLYDAYEYYKKTPSDEITRYNEKLMNIRLDDKQKGYMMEKLNIIMTGKMSEEAGKARIYLNFVLDFPFGIYRNTDVDMGKYLCSVENHLNEKLYGMKPCKKQIMRHVMNFKMGNTTNIVALCGKAGVGKTRIVRTLAEAMGVPFRLIQGGCLTNLESLIGNAYAYVGSTPGMIARTIKDFGCLSGIICIDEIDKITNQSVLNALIHILDRTQGDCFCDDFVGDIPIDLSKIMFFTTLNDVGKLGDILKNRLLMVKVEGYTDLEKVEIAKKHIIPNLTKNSLIKNKKILEFDDDVIRFVMDGDSGVRSLERRLGGIIDNIHYKYLTDKVDINKRLTVESVKVYLD